MKAIVAGGRNFKGTAEHYEWLYKICKKYSVNEIVSGGATGADRFGECFGFDNGMEVTFFKADWNKLGKSAGPIRNLEMAKYAVGNYPSDHSQDQGDSHGHY